MSASYKFIDEQAPVVAEGILSRLLPYLIQAGIFVAPSLIQSAHSENKMEEEAKKRENIGINDLIRQGFTPDSARAHVQSGGVAELKKVPTNWNKVYNQYKGPVLGTLGGAMLAAPGIIALRNTLAKRKLAQEKIYNKNKEQEIEDDAKMRQVMSDENKDEEEEY